MPYEPTQHGNPHELTTRQHILSRAHIERFARDGQVEVTTKKYDHTSLKVPTSDTFCADRVWSQKAESGVMKRIEDSFIEGLRRIDDEEKVDHEALTEYWALWLFRARHGFEEHEDVELRGIEGTNSEPTKDEEELLEKRGISFIRQDGTIPSRLSLDIPLMRHLDMIRLTASKRGWRWRVIETQEDLILGDSPFSLSEAEHAPLIPLGPQLVAVTNVVLAHCGDTGPSLAIGDRTFPGWVNQAFKATAQSWYLSRPSEE